MNDIRLCPETGLPLYRDVRKMSLTYKDQLIEVDMPGWYSNQPDQGESLHSGEDMKVSDRALNLMKARQEGLLEPEEIRRIRKKLHLTQAMAGEMLGGGPRAFQKYESGDLLPSRAVCSALRLLDHHPDSIDIIKTRQPFGTGNSVAI